MISRSYAWIDETIEHSEQDEARAAALAKKWSQLMTSEENRMYDRMARQEYECDYDPYEDCECDYCMIQNHCCEWPNGDPVTTELTECESRKQDRLQRKEQQAERDLEIELIEDKLNAIGARMMRPYEHWNEDERYMEYMENREY